MKRFISILLCLCASAFSQHASVSIAGGMSFAVGDGSEDINPGLCASFEPHRRISRFFGIGGHVDYTWLSVDTRHEDIRAGFHFIDVGLVPKLHVDLSGDNSMFFEVDPALLFAVRYMRFFDESDSEIDPYFAMTYGFGFELGNFVVGFKFKDAFTEGDNVNWLNLYVGFIAR